MQTTTEIKTYNPYTEGNKPTKILPAKSPIDLSEYPNFSATGSIAGMKKKYYGKGALLIKKGAYIYNVSSTPDLYFYLEEKQRLEELRAEIQAERISTGELCELQSLIPYIDKGDVELLEAAGLPEFEEPDLFETPELIPENVRAVFEKYCEHGELTYETILKLHTEVEQLGYTFEYYLDAVPYDLRKIETNQ